MKLKSTLFLFLLFITRLAAGQAYVFDFSTGDHGFIGGVSDFHVNQSGQHQFTFDNRDLPSPFPPGEKSQYMSGVNPSDDLFMYMKKQITLQPFTTYLVTFYVEFASIYPTNAIGVGGAPGEGVTMKAGVTKIEPDTTIIQKGGAFVAMNIDKGNQSQPGVDMDTIGHVGVNDTTTVYTLKTNDNASSPFTFTTDGSGNAWIIVGTDSGFESTTSLYFTSITADFDIVNAVDDPATNTDIKIYPNPCEGEFTIESISNKPFTYKILDLTGKELRQTGKPLPTGIYLVKIKSEGKEFAKKLIVR